MSVTGSAASPDLNCLKGKISSLSPYAVDKTLSVEGAGADAKAVGDALEGKVGYSAVVDNLTTSDTNAPLSANQGVVLKRSISEAKTEMTMAIETVNNAAKAAQNTADSAMSAATDARNYAGNALTTVQDELSKKAEAYSFYGRLPVGGWSSTAPYTQSIAVEGLLATDEPFVDVYLEDVEDGTAILEAFTLVGRLSVSANNTVTAYCYGEAPAVAIPLMFRVVR